MVPVRNIEEQYHQYEGLRKAVYKRVAHRINRPSDREELISFINEYFIRSTLEYDPRSPVDYPGYIKATLDTRARGTFLKLHRKFTTRDTPVDAHDIVLYQDFQNNDSAGVDPNAFLKYVSSCFEFTDPERVVVAGLFNQERRPEIAYQLHELYGMTKKQANETYEEVRDLLGSAAKTFTSGNR